MKKEIKTNLIKSIVFSWLPPAIFVISLAFLEDPIWVLTWWAVLIGILSNLLIYIIVVKRMNKTLFVLLVVYYLIALYFGVAIFDLLSSGPLLG